MTRKPKPREMPSMTDAQRRDNWWRYHWLYVLAGVLAATAAAGVAWERLTRERYDCSVALVTKYAAAPAEIASMQAALETVCPDLDGDGEVHVAVNAIQIDYTSTRMDDAAIQVMTTNVVRPAGGILRGGRGRVCRGRYAVGGPVGGVMRKEREYEIFSGF